VKIVDPEGKQGDEESSMWGGGYGLFGIIYEVAYLRVAHQ
jgi:hypothetical protein